MQLHDWPTLSFFTQPAAMTSAGRYARPLDPLPRHVAGLTAVAQGLLVHEHIASDYGVTLSDEDRDSVHIRPVERLLECITARDRWRQIRDRRESSLPGRTVDSAAARRCGGRWPPTPVLHLGAQMVRRPIVDPRFPARLRELREQRGLSLRELARQALSSKSHVHQFEVGKKTPRTDTARRIDDALGAGGELAGMVIAVGAESGSISGLEFQGNLTHAVDAAADLWRADMERRAVLRQAAFAAPAFATPAMRWLTAAFDDQPTGQGARPVDERDVDTIRRMTATLRGLDNEYGGGHVRDMVVRYLDGEVAPLLRHGRYDVSTGSTLMSAAAELTQPAGRPTTQVCTVWRSGT